PADRPQLARSGRKCDAGGAALRSATDTCPISALLRSMERPDCSLRSGGNAVKFFFSVFRSRARPKLQAVIGMPAAFLVAAVFFGRLGLAPSAHAQQDRYLDVHGAGEFQPISIAVTAFSGEAATSAQLTT